jgi:adenylate cyclase
MRALDNAFAQAEESGVAFWTAELHRRRGELLLASGGQGAAAAACFRDALACASAQGARSLELRAALSLARLHRRHGEFKAGDAILRPVYRNFVQGFDTPDLVQARQLLEAAEQA